MEKAEELEKQHAEGNTPASKMKIPAPSKQTMVEWVCAAWLELAKTVNMAKKLFLVTGISNALGNYEDHLVGIDDLKKEKDSIFGICFRN